MSLPRTAKTTKKWLEIKFIRVMFWPGQSPDLNPSESIRTLIGSHNIEWNNTDSSA